MADISEKLEKQMEGTNLALAAVAEVLQKMDLRLAKEAEEEEAEENEKAMEKAQAQLVKSVATEVVAMLKAGEGDSYAGSDASGDERKAKPTGGTPQNSDDSESAAGISSKIEDQQNTIQAADMGSDDDDDEEVEKDGDDEEEEKKGMYKGDDEDEASDEPVEEKGMDDEDDDDMEKMQKQLESLKKQIADTEANMQKSIQTESENRLRKMGFREETGLQAPKVVNGLGVDDTTPIQKAAGVADTVGQLAELSYSELRRMQHQIDTGNTDGVPRELLGQ